MSKINSLDEVYKKINALQKVILLSKKKTDIVKAFKDITCIITGKCVCESCPEWDKETFVVYEFGRCLVPSRFLQLVKEVHLKSKRWDYIKPLYRDLYSNMYEDLLPDTDVFSNGDAENQKCGFKLSSDLLEAASKELEKVQKINTSNLKKMRKIQLNLGL
jgi:hypothetical protein